ncbi:shematrin-like protein 1 [Cephus cinctus]|uniref:Shematrin-like protein 1 n=1 Tax=Cephus cinctus TaxID=211228 RepID=A0AAJ7C4J7_CEPCN|nr:shematrin-like protein 1 [Cephus cinctus]
MGCKKLLSILIVASIVAIAMARPGGYGYRLGYSYPITYSSYSYPNYGYGHGLYSNLYSYPSYGYGHGFGLGYGGYL